ncbi:hybrid nucleoside-diphosphate sugar epimerase/sugar transferase [Sphingomonas xanthus]|uniref:NAD-dependent epimerase/dehydratase family protein n=1 Tax=Sphingomonas xanthus TaxID=2594473 RepID=A0A516IU62_9SPHN|nr:hybrid nucleoside-diphosphate sugar epimerase/sugar transferase [Sphingomonas xanthus]QDP20443.1 NAD-dependent epimerase/dehydratase family protein [Sphingomonas xanthus]
MKADIWPRLFRNAGNFTFCDRTPQERHFSVTTVAVTGASGRVGQAVIPELLATGIDVRLFGRSKERIQSIFPGCSVHHNSEISHQLSGCDAIIHLATINNDVDSVTEESARRVNVDWPLQLARHAREKGVPRFIFMSSTHALDPDNQSLYAQTKRELANRLAEVAGIDIVEVVAPKIYDHRQRWTSVFWKLLGGLKPTISTSAVASVIADELRRPPSGPRVKLISSSHPRPRYYDMATTGLDYVAAISILIGFGWLLLLIAIAVRLDSPGPALFRQERVGRNQAKFICWKFRTMRVGTAHRATHETCASSVTRIGAFLRRTKLDELPQVVNLLKRELSLVGPRPCLPNQRKLIQERQARGVFEMRPGITGLAQVNGIDMSDPARLAIWDERYSALRSLQFDLKILLSTFLGKGRGDKVLHGN